MTPAGVDSRETRDQFLQLLTTQLRYQDPLEPVKQENFLAQLAQFSTLEGIERLNLHFEDMLRMQELTQGANLIGSSVTYELEDTGLRGTGRAEGWSIESGRFALLVEGRPVPLQAIQTVTA